MWETIKNILKKTNGTCIIVEEGKPAFVVSRFEDFSASEDKIASRPKESSGDQELLEKINQEITNWKTRQAEDEAEAAVAPEEEIKIESLPLA